ncbi:MAG: 4Fe-4S dicluster domain-containing protein [Planctomycetia bacterium]|nr:4Fe-4S dicluster domain-containing protein [Planctomycetia bacterium]
MARRQFLTTAALLTMASSAQAQEKPKIKFDGGLSKLIPRGRPVRTEEPTPPGSLGQPNFERRCVGCLLCVQACENHVLRPADAPWWAIATQRMSFEEGYCRSECVKCSEVCPTGAILPITPAGKTVAQIGYAVWSPDRCIVLTDRLLVDVSPPRSL